jgi:hypothetical protein
MKINKEKLKAIDKFSDEVLNSAIVASKQKEVDY